MDRLNVIAPVSIFAILHEKSFATDSLSHKQNRLNRIGRASSQQSLLTIDGESGWPDLAPRLWRFFDKSRFLGVRYGIQIVSKCNSSVVDGNRLYHLFENASRKNIVSILT